MKPTQAWHDFDTLKELRSSELADILQLAEKTKGFMGKRRMPALAERFHAWSTSAQEDLSQYFKDYPDLTKIEGTGIAEKMGIDLTKEEDLIRFYYGEFIGGAFRMLTGPDEDPKQRFDALEKLFNTLKSMANKSQVQGIA